MTRDVVCGMETEATEYRLAFGDVTYLFCSAGCLEEFRRHPEDYAPNQDVSRPEEDRDV